MLKTDMMQKNKNKKQKKLWTQKFLFFHEDKLGF